MSMKLAKWLAVLLMTLCLAGCFIQQNVIPAFLPKTEQDVFVKRIDYLKSQGVGVDVVGDTIRLVLYTDDFFEMGTAEFFNRREPVLTTIAQILNTRGCAPVFVSGHTDDIGTKEHKEKLSYDWAFTISSYLWHHGVDRDRIRVRGYADHYDIASYRTVAGSSYNRRVEIFMDTPR